MVDVNNIGNTLDQFKDVDRKITIRLIKEKRSMRSYIEGLEDFMTEEQIEIFRNQLKKKLGTGSTEKELQENKRKYKIYGFNGDHRETLKLFLMEKGIDEEKISVKA